MLEFIAWTIGEAIGWIVASSVSIPWRVWVAVLMVASFLVSLAAVGPGTPHRVLVLRFGVPVLLVALALLVPFPRKQT